MICALIVMVLVFVSQTALACSVCFGDPKSSLTMGLNFGIMTMLAVLFIILLSFAVLFVNIGKKGQKHA